jgi:hypothetical protein
MNQFVWILDEHLDDAADLLRFPEAADGDVRLTDAIIKQSAMRHRFIKPVERKREGRHTAKSGRFSGIMPVSVERPFIRTRRSSPFEITSLTGYSLTMSAGATALQVCNKDENERH